MLKSIQTFIITLIKNRYLEALQGSIISATQLELRQEKFGLRLLYSVEKNTSFKKHVKVISITTLTIESS